MISTRLAEILPDWIAFRSGKYGTGNFILSGCHSKCIGLPK
jgi:hypothetical protein